MNGARLIAFGLAGLVLGACGTETGPGPAEPLEECFAGVWIEAVFECSDCGTFPETPECDAPDCEGPTVTIAHPDGGYRRRGLRVSRSLGTLSDWGRGGGLQQWSIVDDQSVDVTLDGAVTSSFTMIRCTESELELQITSLGASRTDTWSRADAAVSGAVMRAWETDEWVSVPLGG